MATTVRVLNKQYKISVRTSPDSCCFYLERPGAKPTNCYLYLDNKDQWVLSDIKGAESAHHFVSFHLVVSRGFARLLLRDLREAVQKNPVLLKSVLANEKCRYAAVRDAYANLYQTALEAGSPNTLKYRRRWKRAHAQYLKVLPLAT